MDKIKIKTNSLSRSAKDLKINFKRNFGEKNFFVVSPKNEQQNNALWNLFNNIFIEDEVLTNIRYKNLTIKCYKIDNIDLFCKILDNEIFNDISIYHKDNVYGPWKKWLGTKIETMVI